MTVYTSRFGFKWNYQPHDTGWGTDYNFAHRELAAVLHLYLISDAATTPPGSPAENDTYLVPSTGTGAWSTQHGKIAAFQGGAWQYYAPEVGTRARIANRSGFYWYDGAIWNAELTSGGGTYVQTVAGHAPDLAGNVSLVVGDITGAAPLSSAALTGTPTAPTRAANNNSTGIATTEYVDRAIGAIGGLNSVAAGTGINVSVSGGVYTVSINSSVVETVSALATALGSYLPLAGGTMTGALHLSAPAGSDNTDKAVSSAWVRTYVTSLGFGTGTGTVTSVDLTMPALFSVSGNPVTGSGTLAVALATQTANTVLAGPTTGSPAAPTMRALVAADLPATPVWLPFSAEGLLTSSEVLPGIAIPAALTIPSGASGVAIATASTGAVTLNFSKNGTNFATATWSAGVATGTVSVASTTTFAAGDVLGWALSGTADATFADPKVTLTGTR